MSYFFVVDQPNAHLLFYKKCLSIETTNVCQYHLSSSLMLLLLLLLFSTKVHFLTVLIWYYTEQYWHFPVNSRGLFSGVLPCINSPIENGEKYPLNSGIFPSFSLSTFPFSFSIAMTITIDNNKTPPLRKGRVINLDHQGNLLKIVKLTILYVTERYQQQLCLMYSSASHGEFPR